MLKCVPWQMEGQSTLLKTDIEWPLPLSLSATVSARQETGFINKFSTRGLTHSETFSHHFAPSYYTLADDIPQPSPSEGSLTRG